jgi:beta-lactamase class A
MSQTHVSYARLFGAIGVVTALAIIAALLLEGHSSAAERHPKPAPVSARPVGRARPKPEPTPKPKPTPTPIPTLVPAPAADAALRSDVAQANGSASVAITDLSTGRSLAYGGGGHGFATASIVKMDILATLLLQAQDQGTTLTDDQEQLATTMIENSDNDSATALWDEIGDEDGLNAANKRFGLTSTAGGTEGNWGLTTTTAADQLLLLRQVFTSDSLLSSASRDYIQGLMSQVESDQQWGVGAAATGAFANKDGWLPRSATGLWVINSIGEVDRDGQELLIATLSDGNPSESDGISLVQSLAVDAAQSLGTS